MFLSTFLPFKLIVAGVGGALVWKYGPKHILTLCPYSRAYNGISGFCISYTLASGVAYVWDWLYPNECSVRPLTRRNTST